MNSQFSTEVDVAAVAARHPAVVGEGTAVARRLTLVVAGLTMSVIGAVVVLGIDTRHLVSGLAELGRMLRLMLPPSYGTTARLILWLKSIGETVSIALLGTLLAAAFTFPVSLLAASNICRIRPLRFLTRRWLDAVRGVNTLIWALIWIDVVGLGPFAGVLAIMTSDFGTFGKLFSEAFEAADPKPGESVVAAGGSNLLRVRFGLLPQVGPVLAGLMLYMFESNTRSATIIGIVGAGGIGQYLTEAIRTLEWRQVSFLVLLVLATVALIDTASGYVRRRLGGKIDLL